MNHKSYGVKGRGNFLEAMKESYEEYFDKASYSDVSPGLHGGESVLKTLRHKINDIEVVTNNHYGVMFIGDQKNFSKLKSELEIKTGFKLKEFG